jgi:hypothetical protein
MLQSRTLLVIIISRHHGNHISQVRLGLLAAYALNLSLARERGQHIVGNQARYDQINAAHSVIHN